jgi:hypothetical protein
VLEMELTPELIEELFKALKGAVMIHRTR